MWMSVSPCVKVHLLVEDCEERLAEDEVEDILRIIAELL
jgi:hypothetical protein